MNLSQKRDCGERLIQRGLSPSCAALWMDAGTPRCGLGYRLASEWNWNGLIGIPLERCLKPLTRKQLAACKPKGER